MRSWESRDSRESAGEWLMSFMRPRRARETAPPTSVNSVPSVRGSEEETL